MKVVKVIIEKTKDMYSSYAENVAGIYGGGDYKGIFTNSALERITGINQKQFQHYASGLKKPRAAQAKKIESALHKLGSELLALEL